MRRKRARLIGWTYDDETQELRTPHGRVLSIHDIATMLADQRDCRLDLDGKWSGWRLRQQWLIVPGGTMKRGRIAQHVLRHLTQMSEWEQQDLGRRQLALF